MELRLEASESAKLAERLFEHIQAAVQEKFTQLGPTGPHWISHADAIESYGWPEVLLRRGIDAGLLNPIVLLGRGGTKYLAQELDDYSKWIIDQRRAGTLPPEFLSSKLTLGIHVAHQHNTRLTAQPGAEPNPVHANRTSTRSGKGRVSAAAKSTARSTGRR